MKFAGATLFALATLFNRATLFALATPFALATLGCATKHFGPTTVRWEDAPAAAAPASVSTLVPAVMSTRSATPGRKTAAAIAAEGVSAGACVDIAGRYPPEPRAAIFRECMHRPDFLNLTLLLQEPYLEALKRSAPMQAGLVEVIARRGGFIEGDFTEFAKADVPLFMLNTALANPRDMRGALVVVRGIVKDVRSERRGHRVSFVAALEETSWLGDDPPEGPATRGDIGDELTAAQRTGRKIFVRLQQDGQLRRDDEVVVLMAFEAPRTILDEDGENEASAIGVFTAAFLAAPSLRQ